MTHIIICGLKHCGKSTKGRILAERLNWLFADLDDLILEEISQSSIREFYRECGVQSFQDQEALAAEKFLRKNLNQNWILALGGGTIENSSAMKALNPVIPDSGIQGTGKLKEILKPTMIYLQEEPAVLFERIQWRGLPPFLDQKNPLHSFTKLYKKRHPLYLEVADIIAVQGKRSIESEVDELEKLIRSINHGR